MARRSRLFDIVEGLPEAKGSTTPPRAAIRQLRKKMLSMQIKDLARMRMTRKAHEAMPHLATERRNPDLLERVTFIATEDMDRIAWPTVGRILLYLYNEDGLRKAAFERAKKDAPHNGPRWLRTYWEHALQKKLPARRLAKAALEAQPILIELPQHLQLRQGTPLCEEVMVWAVQLCVIEDQPWTDTLRWIERSGTAPRTRRLLLRRILETWPVQQPEDLARSDALMDLYRLAALRMGGPPALRPGLWRDMPDDVRAAGDMAWKIPPLDEERRIFWMVHLHKIVRVDTNAVCAGIVVGDQVYAEALSFAHAIRIYSRTAWEQHFPDLPPETSMRVPREELASLLG